MRKLTRSVLLAIGCVLLFGGSLQGQTKRKQTRPPRSEKPERQVLEPGSSAEKYFTDVELLNQDGEKMRLYTDLLKGHTVAIIPFFTTCTSICPPMNATMSRIQKELGDRVGNQIFLISISVDPATDVPERLKAYAAKFHALPGWYFITGKPENVHFALKKLGQDVTDKNDHSAIMIIGNEATGLWKKAYALSSSLELAKIVAEVSNDLGKSPMPRN